MTLMEAKRYLEARMRQRFDGHSAGWTVADAEAVRKVLSHMRELEDRLSLRRAK